MEEEVKYDPLREGNVSTVLIVPCQGDAAVPCVFLPTGLEEDIKTATSTIDQR